MKYRVSVGGRAHEVEVRSRRGGMITLAINGREYSVQVAAEGSPGPAVVRKTSSSVVPAAKIQSEGDGAIRAPMPGIVAQICVAIGTQVAPGEIMFIIEAMKMENSITATRGGTVREILVTQGGRVAGGEVLARIE